jgi:hypothetical protein
VRGFAAVRIGFKQRGVRKGDEEEELQTCNENLRSLGEFSLLASTKKDSSRLRLGLKRAPMVVFSRPPEGAFSEKIFCATSSV